MAQTCFRAVLFRMVPKHDMMLNEGSARFRAVLFRMVPKQQLNTTKLIGVLELCCFEWFQNTLQCMKTLK